MLHNNKSGYRNKFIIGIRSPKNENVDIYKNYKKTLEISLILTLLFTIVLFHLLPDSKKEESIIKNFSIAIEAINIPVIIEEPPPPVIEEEITTYKVIAEEKKPDPRKLRDEIEKVELKMDLVEDTNLLANSQIGNVSYAGFSQSSGRDRSALSLDFNSQRNRFRNNNGSLDFDVKNKKTVNKKFVDNSIKLDTSPTEILKKPQKIKKKEVKKNENLIKGNNQFILKESESTIGTNEYRLWNKINAVLDRLDKNRFGKLPQNVIRTAKGLNLAFNYRDGIQHDVFWEKGGKVIIRVTGQQPRKLTYELEKAYDALIRLTL